MSVRMPDRSDRALVTMNVPALAAAVLLLVAAAGFFSGCTAPDDGRIVPVEPIADGAAPPAETPAGGALFTAPDDEPGRAIAAAIPAAPTVRPARDRRILVFHLCEGFRHSVIPTANRAFVLMGEKTGAFKADLSESMDAFEAENLARYDAILLNNTTHLSFAEERYRRNLIDFVTRGGGLVGIHAATDCFFEWPEAAEMIGGVFDGHPWGSKGTWAVRIEEPGHPLNRAFEGRAFLVCDEIYQFREPYSRDRLRVLLGLDMSNSRNLKVEGIKRDDNDFAISWIRTLGEGRVFYCSLGHNEEIFSSPAIAAHMLDGIQFALGDLEADATPSGSLATRPRLARTTDPGGIEDPFAGAAAFRHGESRRFLHRVEEMIRTAAPQELSLIETRLLAILESTTSTAAGRQFACRMLRRAGSEAAVPLLAKLLVGADSDNARFALEGLAAPGVDAAFLDALGRSEGDELIGVIGSIGSRKISAAVPALGNLAGHPDSRVAAASLAALGRIGDTEAARALGAMTLSAPLDGLRDDAILECADDMTARGERAQALALYESLASRSGPVMARIAASRGIILARPERALPTLSLLYRETDRRYHEAAALFTVELPGGTDTSHLTDDLPSLAPEAQVVLLGALAHRGDRPAAGAAADLIGSSDAPAVRLAAIEALGALGGPDDVPLLAARAASVGAEGEASSTSLARLSGAGINEALITAARASAGAERAVLLDTLAQRGTSGAEAVLLDCLRDAEAPVRTAAIAGLGRIGRAAELPALLELLADPADESDRSGIEKALLETCRRMGDDRSWVDPLTSALPDSDAVTRAALVRVLGKLPGADTLPVVTGAASDDDEEVRAAAVRALAAWPDSSPIDTLLPLTVELEEGGLRSATFAGALRMAAADAGVQEKPTEVRFQTLMAASRSTEEINLILESAKTLSDSWVLAFVRPCLEDPATRPAAAEAERKVSSAIARKVSHDAVGCTVKHTHPVAEKYTGGDPDALTDGTWGSSSYGDGRWQAIKGKDMIAVVDLGKEIPVRDIRAGYLLDAKSWIFLPRKVVFALSADGETFTTIATVEKNDPGKILPPVTDDFFTVVEDLPARYVRVHAFAVGVCPEWHSGSGSNAWLFADEIQVNARLSTLEDS